MKAIITKNLIVLCLVSLMLALGACSKFDEGPCISFRSIDARIHGKYKVVYFAKNDIELTADWNENYNLEFEFYEGEEDFYRYSFIVKGFINVNNDWSAFAFRGPYYFKSDHGQVEFHFNVLLDTTMYPDRLCYPLILHPSSGTNKFTITKLTDQELWLEQLDGNDYYEIHFEE